MKFNASLYAEAFGNNPMAFKLTDNIFEADTIEEATEMVDRVVNTMNRVFAPKNTVRYKFVPKTLFFRISMGINPDWKKDDSQQE